MDETLRTALMNYLSERGLAVDRVLSTELYANGPDCQCCEGDIPTLDIHWKDRDGGLYTYEVTDSELNEFLLYLLKAVPR